MESSHFLAISSLCGTLQNVFFDFWFRPPNAKNLLPKIGNLGHWVIVYMDVRHSNVEKSVQGALKMQDMKMQDLKLTDQCAGHEIAGCENEGPICKAWNCRTWKWQTKYIGHKSAQPENAGHEIAGHAKAKQKTSSNVWVWIDWVVFCADSCSDAWIVEDQSRLGLSHRLEHTRNSQCDTGALNVN